MADAALARALVRWQHAAGPYWPFVCAAPFLAADAPARSRVSGRSGGGRSDDAACAALHAALTGSLADDGPVAVLADLPIEATLAEAPAMVARGWYVVPVIQRWPAEPAILPSRPILRLLIAGAARIGRPRSPRGVVLLADGERAGPVSASGRIGRAGTGRVERRAATSRGPTASRIAATRRAFDNRYAYESSRFPPAALLRQEGVRVVRWVCQSGIARDLAPYAADLRAARLAVEIVGGVTAGGPAPEGVAAPERMATPEGAGTQAGREMYREIHADGTALAGGNRLTDRADRGR